MNANALLHVTPNLLGTIKSVMSMYDSVDYHLGISWSPKYWIIVLVLILPFLQCVYSKWIEFTSWNPLKLFQYLGISLKYNTSFVRCIYLLLLT